MGMYKDKLPYFTLYKGLKAPIIGVKRGIYAPKIRHF